MDEEYIEQLELYLEPTDLNKKFKGLNDLDKNLVVKLGLEMLHRGLKNVQLWKNDEWKEKLVELEERKNKEISMLKESVELKKVQLKDLMEDQRKQIVCIKNEVKEQTNEIYKNKMDDYDEKIKSMQGNLETEKEKMWSLQQTFYNDLTEKTEVIRKEEEEKRNSLRKQFDTLLEKEREKYLSISRRQENSTLLGQDGESFTYHNLNMLFPKSEVIDTHDEKQCGDFKLIYKNLPLLLEVKNYSGNVLKKEILKFRRDMEFRSEMKGGVFISLKSGISAYSDFQLEIYGGRPVIFLTYVKKDFNKIQLAVKLIETIVKENIDLKNEELVGGLKKLVPVIKRKWNSLKGTLENFKNKMSRDILEQESNIIEIFKIIGMKY